jgi:hypothetical protein
MRLNRYARSVFKDRYYHLWIAAAKDQSFFETNLDKAYMVSLFQDHLSPRISHQSLASEIDLIAYSLTNFGMNLLLCASSTKGVEDFGQSLLMKYADFLHQQFSWEILPFNTIFAYDILADEHEALAISREIHLLHDDWRNDRYSSIGFYLDDRRGDWLQPWRLADLYDNDPTWYQNFLMDDGLAIETGNLKFLET